MHDMANGYMAMGCVRKATHAASGLMPGVCHIVQTCTRSHSDKRHPSWQGRASTMLALPTLMCLCRLNTSLCLVCFVLSQDGDGDIGDGVAAAKDDETIEDLEVCPVVLATCSMRCHTL